MEIYHWSRCSTCRSARDRLRQRGVETHERDFFAQPLSRAELADLAARAGGMAKIFSFGSPSFRKLERDPSTLGEAEMIELVLGEPRLLRRPLATHGGRVFTGSQVGEAGS